MNMANPDRERKRILLVEDNEDDRGLVVFKLREHKVTFACDFDEGLPLARHGYFDLYILDNWLPGGSGIGLCRLIRPLDIPVVEVFPDVSPVLAELQARGIRMAIVSDNWGDLEKSFSHLGLRQFFDVFVVSEAMGCCKPDPRMYWAGSDGLGLAPSECLFVDNDPDLVLAAINLGYQGIVIDRYGSERRSAVKWIEKLSDLWPFLGTIAPDQS